MRKFTLISLIILSLSKWTFCQDNVTFNIVESFLTDSIKIQSKNNLIKDSVFYEDENYVVRRTCSGEFGGSVWFQNKKTKIEYSCRATCPIVINKINNKYFVTSSLAHMMGSTEIIEIENPDKMEIFKLPKAKKIGKIWIRTTGYNQSNSLKGSKQILDSVGVLTFMSFTYKNELYHIVTDQEKTYLCKIQDNKFITINTISQNMIWTDDPQVYRTIDNHTIVFFSYYKVEGYLDIFENNIKIIRNK